MAQNDRPSISEETPILVVDDNDDVRRVLVRHLKTEASRIVEDVSSASEARERLEKRRFGVIITDLSMPEEDGISLMQWGKNHDPDSIWIVLTGFGTMDAAVSALQLGAFDFLSKPIDLTQLDNSVRNGVEHARLLADRRDLLNELGYSNERLREHVEHLEEACSLLSEQAQTIQSDLRRAGIIQQALLPQVAPNSPGFNIRAVYRPSQIVGGDLYDIVRLDDRRLAIMIADAAGHGLSAAMLAVIFRQQIPLFIPNTRTPSPPSAALSAVNRSLLRGFHVPGLFVTAAYCIIDLAKESMTIASAGHPPLIIQRKNGAIERVYHTGPALGLYPDSAFTEQKVELQEGDRIFFHTDGLYDHLQEGDESLADKLEALLQREPAHSDELLQSFLRPESGSEKDDAVEDVLSTDDVTMLMLTKGEGTSRLDNGTPLPIPPATQSPRQREAEILVGMDSHRTCISVQGKASWIQSSWFHDECLALIEDGTDLLLDLTLCQGIDSTFLGTLHELSDRAEHNDVELRLQGVVPPVEALFTELGMKQVIDHIVTTMLPLPSRMVPLVETELSDQDRIIRVLKAHERLASISDSNRQQFAPLIEQLTDEANERGVES